MCYGLRTTRCSTWMGADGTSGLCRPSHSIPQTTSTIQSCRGTARVEMARSRDLEPAAPFETIEQVLHLLTVWTARTACPGLGKPSEIPVGFDDERRLMTRENPVGRAGKLQRAPSRLDTVDRTCQISPNG